MKAWLGILGIFGIGAGVGFFVGERYGRKKAEEEATAAIDEAFNEANSKIPEYVHSVMNSPETPEGTAETIMRNEGYIQDDTEDDAEAEHPSDDTPDECDEPLIEILFDEDLFNQETEYDCHELYFYEEDGVICDEDEHLIHDPEELIGPNTISEMNRLGVDMIFAKNHWNESFYKIMRIENAYGRAVLGLDDNYAGYHDEDDQ